MRRLASAYLVEGKLLLEADATADQEMWFPTGDIEAVPDIASDEVVGEAVWRSLAASGLMAEHPRKAVIVARERNLFKLAGVSSGTAMSRAAKHVSITRTDDVVRMDPSYVDKPVHGFTYSRLLEPVIIKGGSASEIGHGLRTALDRCVVGMPTRRARVV